MSKNLNTIKAQPKPVMVHNLDPVTWRRARAHAELVGLQMGAVVGEALKLWLGKVRAA